MENSMIERMQMSHNFTRGEIKKSLLNTNYNYEESVNQIIQEKVLKNQHKSYLVDLAYQKGLIGNHSAELLYDCCIYRVVFVELRFLPNLTAKDVFELFQPCGEIYRVFLNREQNISVVCFVGEESIERALKLDGYLVGGKGLYVMPIWNEYLPFTRCAMSLATLNKTLGSDRPDWYLDYLHRKYQSVVANAPTAPIFEDKPPPLPPKKKQYVPSLVLPDTLPQMSVFVTNLSTDTDIETLSDFFSFLGTVDYIVLYFDTVTLHRSAVIFYQSESIARRALLMNNASICGSQIVVNPMEDQFLEGLEVVDIWPKSEDINVSNNQLLSNNETELLYKTVTNSEIEETNASDEDTSSVIQKLLTAGYVLGDDVSAKAAELDRSFNKTVDDVKNTTVVRSISDTADYVSLQARSLFRGVEGMFKSKNQ